MPSCTPPPRATARSMRSMRRCGKALSTAYPEIGATQLFDYKVRVLDGRDGTAAGVRVLVESG